MTQLNQPEIADIEQPISWVRSVFSYGMTILAFTLTVIAVLPLFGVLWSIISKGLKELNWETLTELPVGPGMEAFTPNGFANAIVGSLVMVGIASLISLPFGVFTGIFLAEFVPGSPVKTVIRFIIKILSSVPSIIVGVFAYGVLVLTMGSFSGVAGGFALSVIMLPVIALTTEESLKLVPNEYRLAAAALGAGKFQSLCRIILPAALGSIITGSLLAIARAAGETAPLLFTALFNQFWAESLTKGPVASLPVFIYNYAISPFPAQNDLAWTAALVLITLVLIINLTSRLLTWKK